MNVKKGNVNFRVSRIIVIGKGPFFSLFCFTLFLRALIALSTALCVILYLTLILLILAKYGEFPTQGEQATGQNDQELPELYDTK